jgi:hypothetical protein
LAGTVVDIIGNPGDGFLDEEEVLNGYWRQVIRLLPSHRGNQG